MTNLEKIDQLENQGMLDLMHHQWSRYQSVKLHINVNALWQRWVRS